MKEDFLYYLWKFQKFDSECLRTSEAEPLQIISTGAQNNLSGPDFFNAHLIISGIKWAGNVEMHLKSSDWYLHNHETDPAYDNVILHVVWEHDENIFRRDRSLIPVFELKNIVDYSMIAKYRHLLESRHNSINCEDSFSELSSFEIDHWFERLYFERLERKSELIFAVLQRSNNDWNRACMILLFRAFGLNINGEYFSNMAENLSYSLVAKLGGNQFSLEALFLGYSNLIHGADQYSKELLTEFEFLKHKFNIPLIDSKPEFFRLRPDNFPTIRLAQLASLYAQRPSFFSGIIAAKDFNEIKFLFITEVSAHWKTHYNFDKSHNSRSKKLSNSFLELLVINFVIPLKFAFSKSSGEPASSLYEIVTSLKAEKNSITRLYNSLRPGTVKNALESQAVLELKKNYCSKCRCLHCELGATLLRNSVKYV
ncbi:uncharacterized protein DUF2851 [Gramella sp. Hel_I_59]|uniref:DUF2851 family protein n=1 Tax=Gramella sp. Hel_I_59 TaxID=1249978 RepID=UPI001153F717|nr:DUF2851 family protein [Gramella sp. Hel_I_59]TQI70087.1 uncharacterized protein DUF2851 [Gramella sp. Hel_I_59]